MLETPKLSEIKKALPHYTQQELIEFVLRLARLKVENKELLCYLLFEAEDEVKFVQKIKVKISAEFKSINTSSYYLVRKSVRKQLKEVKKYIRFSKKQSTEIELLLYFLSEMLQLKPSILKDKRLMNIYQRSLKTVDQKISGVHEDLQYDYLQQLNDL